ncbi:MAG: hypothetical protein ACLVKK_08220 [Ruthenibacterium sp.]
MKKARKFLCGLLAAALLACMAPAAIAEGENVIYIGNTGSDENSGLTAEKCVQSWEKAYELVNNGGTIVVTGESTVTDSIVPMASKCVTVTGSYEGTAGGTLVLPADKSMGGLSFGADTTVEHLTIDCSGNDSEIGMFSFYANGHDLTIGEGMRMLAFPNSSYTPYPVVQAGSGNIIPPVPGYPPEACGTITVKSGQYTQINPGSWGEISGAELYLYGGVTVDYVSSDAEVSGAELHIVESSAQNPVTIGAIYETYDETESFSLLAIEAGGYLRITEGSLKESALKGAVKDFSLAQGGTLYLEKSTLEGAFSGSMQGGGLLVMPSGSLLDIPGTASGDTQLQLIPGAAGGAGYIENIKLGTYVTAEETSTGTFALVNDIAASLVQGAGAAGRAEWKLEKAVGSLTVSHTVTGSTGGGPKAFAFTVTVEDLPDGVYGDMAFHNGMASFTLCHGESKTASGLPAGADYIVKLTDAQGYKVTATGNEGQIPKNAEAVAAFICHKETMPPQSQPSEPTADAGQKPNPKTGV